MQVRQMWALGLLVGVLCACGPGLSSGQPGSPGFEIQPNPVPTISGTHVSFSSFEGKAFELVVNGAGFIRSSVIQVNGTKLTTSFLNSDKLVASVTPELLQGSGRVLSVSTPEPGGGVSEERPLALPRPVITNSPFTNVSSAGSSCTVSVLGKNFAQSSRVRRADGSALTANIRTPEWMEVQLDPQDCASARSIDIYVQNVPGDVEDRSEVVPLAVGYRVPKLLDVHPRMIAASGYVPGTGDTQAPPGISLSLQTEYAVPSVTQVRWNGTLVESTTHHSGSITVVIPPELVPTSGRGELTLHNASVGSASNRLEVIVHDGPVLTESYRGVGFGGDSNVFMWVAGSGFREPLSLYWNGSPRTISNISDNRVYFYVPASDLAQPGAALITVQSGGKLSNALGFQVSEQWPVPVARSLSPSILPAGSGARLLQVHGSGFVHTSKVLWNGQERPTSLYSDQRLEVTLTAEDLREAGTARVEVSTPAPGGGTSLPLLLHISSGRQSPVVTRLQPQQLQAGSKDVTLRVYGCGFHPTSVIRWNGVDLPTTFVSPSATYECERVELTALLPDALLAESGVAEVTVSTPGPGGGVSNPSSVTLHTSGQWLLTSLSLEAIEAGAQQLDLSVRLYGVPFGLEKSAVVYIDGKERALLSPVTFYQATVRLTAEDLATPRRLEVRVEVPELGRSAPLFFHVLPPQKPMILKVEPGVMSVGDWNLGYNGYGALLVDGQNIRSADLTVPSADLDTVALWNGVTRPIRPYYQSQGAIIDGTTTDTRTAGMVRLALSRPSVESGAPSLEAFVHLVPERPVPLAWKLMPGSVPRGGADLTLEIWGGGFGPASVVHWNGQPLTTTQGTSLDYRLLARVPAALLATAGTASVTVVTPGPGGGTSAPLSFVVAP